MKILSIEAAASPASVALSLDGDITQRVCEDARPQAEHLLDLIKVIMTECNVGLDDLDGLAVGRGPGSFTGLRVAASLAQGLAYSATKPLANVSSLAAVAHQVFDRNAGSPDGDDRDVGYAKQRSTEGAGNSVKSTESMSENDLSAENGSSEALLVCLDARKAQVYCALYESDELGRPRQVSPEAVLDPDEVVAQFKGKATAGAGGGFSEYPELAALDVDVITDVQPSASAVALRAASGVVPFENPYLATPSYVRNNVTHGS